MSSDDKKGKENTKRRRSKSRSKTKDDDKKVNSLLLPQVKKEDQGNIETTFGAIRMTKSVASLRKSRRPSKIFHCRRELLISISPSFMIVISDLFIAEIGEFWNLEEESLLSQEEARKESKPSLQNIDGDSLLVGPTPIATEGVHVVETVPFNQGLLSIQDREYLSSLLGSWRDSSDMTAAHQEEEEKEKTIQRQVVRPDLDSLMRTEPEPAISSSKFSKEEETTTSTTASNSNLGKQKKSCLFDQWQERYLELIQYRNKFGNGNVPYVYAVNRPLSQWVKRQRHQYKLKKEDTHSHLIDEREMLLNELGFIWDSRAANWEERLDELRGFREEHGHCKGTKKVPEHRPLAVWLKRQRRYCRQYLSGDGTTGMTTDRMAKLSELGVKINFRLDGRQPNRACIHSLRMQ